MPRDTDPELIIGRYIPNLVPRPFSLDRDFIQEIRDLVPAEPLDEILADYDTWRRREAARAVPQGRHRAAGLAVRQPGALDRNAGPAVHRGGRRRSGRGAVRRDRCEVRADGRRAWRRTRSSCPNTPTAQSKCSTPSATQRCCSPPTPTRSPRRRGASRAGRRGRSRAGRCRAGSARRAGRAVGRRSAPRRHRLRRRRRDAGADRAVGEDAHRPDRAAGLDRVDHRRCVLAAQPAAGRPRFRAQPRRHRRRGRGRSVEPEGPGDQAGPHLQAVRPGAVRRDQRSACARCWARPASGRRTSPSASARRGNSATAGPSTSRSRSRSAPGKAAASAAVPRRPARGRACRRRLRRQGRSTRRSPSVAGAPGHRGRAAVGRRRRRCDRRRRRAQRVHRADHRPQRCAGQGGPSGARPARTRRSGHDAADRHRRGADRPGHRRTRLGLAAAGGPGVRRPQGRGVRRPLGQRPRGSGQDLADGRRRDRRRMASSWPSVSRAQATSSARRPAGGRARRLAAGPQHARLAVRPGRRRRGEPGQGSLQRRSRGGDRRLEGFDRRVGGGAAARRRRDRDRDDVAARRRPAGVLPHPLPRQRPLRRHAVGGARQHGLVLRHRRAGGVGRQRADRKPWAAVDPPQGRADPDAAVPVRGAAGRRRPFGGRCARPRWR